MTIIEGIGDEVIQFFVVVFIIIVGLLAWRSTNIAEQPLVRAVLVLEMMTRQRSDATNSNNHVEESSIDTGQSSSQNNFEEESDTVVSEIPPPLKENSELDSESLNESITSTSVTTTGNLQMQNGVEQNLSNEEDTSHIRRRVAVLENQPSSQTFPEKSVSGEDLLTLDSRNNKSSQVNVSALQEEEEECGSPGIIRIRLKYLNDTQKLVEGNLDEQLGDFKRRHFGLEIQTNKLVRLIFNGHVLQSDSETLQNYGLFDNCVVHCLVHNQQVPNSSTSSGNSTEVGQANGVDFREWDMDNHLFGSLSFILVAAWYCRYTYAQLFTTTTTVALVCLTGVFFVSLLGVYLPDQGRERQ